jgi:hypothetical protein
VSGRLAAWQKPSTAAADPAAIDWQESGPKRFEPLGLNHLVFHSTPSRSVESLGRMEDRGTLPPAAADSANRSRMAASQMLYFHLR